MKIFSGGTLLVQVTLCHVVVSFFKCRVYMTIEVGPIAFLRPKTLPIKTIFTLAWCKIVML